MIRQTHHAQPLGLNRGPVVISIALHLGVFGLVLLSPLLRPKPKQFRATKFFRVVNVRPYQARAVTKTKATRKQVRQKKAKPKPRKAPSLSTEVTAAMLEDASATEELEYVLPSEVSVSNPNFVYDWYLAHIQSKVERNWTPPRGISGPEDMSVVLVFEIERNGKMAALRIVKQSGDKTLDHLGLRAIRRAGPFPRLPARFSDDRLEVRFTLNYAL